MSLTVEAFDWVRAVVLADSAIVLGIGKEYLVESRLAPVARAAGCPDVSSYLETLRANMSRQVRQALVEAMTTNETSWFRDRAHYERLERTILPALMSRRPRSSPIRVWSAACSTGQEPYTVAMILLETLGRAGYLADLLATDIDCTALNRAKTGKYSQFEVTRGLPAARLARHFVRDGSSWRISDELRSMVQFRRVNLAGPLPPLGQFDVILMRNVLIYFSEKTRRDILARIRPLCRPDGYLILGAAESPMGAGECWAPTVKGGSTVYRAAG